MPRFVLHRHDYSPDSPQPGHWDFMLEDAGALATWRLAELPTAERRSVAAERIADHRLAYLDYEGPVSGNRGHVRRVDAGEFHWIERDAGKMVLTLTGAAMHGSLRLMQTGAERWQLTFQGPWTA